MNRSLKFVTGDYVGNPCDCSKFGANPSMWGFWGKWVKQQKAAQPHAVILHVDKQLKLQNRFCYKSQNEFYNKT